MTEAFPDARSARATVEQALSDWASEYTAPRDLTLVGSYLAATLPAGRYVIYGAGTQSGQLLPAIAGRSDVQIVGFLDRRAALLPRFHDRPVVVPEQLETLPCDGFILSHYRHERSMRDRLLALGVSPDRIITIYTSEAFVRWSVAACWERVATLPIGDISHLVITCAESPWSLLSNADLARFLPPDRTLHAYFGRIEAVAAKRIDGIFPTIDLRQSLSTLNMLIETAKPRSIYVKSTVYHYGQFLGAYLKLRFPTIVIVQEMYDQALLLTDYKLSHAMDYDTKELTLLRAAERVAFEHCDFVVTKNGGDAWRAMSANFAAPVATYFPRVTGNTTVAPLPSESDPCCRIVFAGTLPRPSAYIEGPEQLDMCYTAMLERMMPDDRFRIDLFNGAHLYADQDETFAAYRTQFPADGIIRYAPALPLTELQALLPRYDYGWHVMHESLATVEPVSRVGIGNKFTTYLQAGLPVLMDSGFEFMAELIEAAGAGLVIAPQDVGNLGETLASTNAARFRPGVAALVQHMAGINTDTASLIADIMKR